MVDWLEPRVRVLYQHRRGGVPELIGSGVLLMRSGYRYLVTAAHLCESAEDSVLMLATDDEIVPLSGGSIEWARNEDADLAVAQLPDDSGLWPVSWFEWSDVIPKLPPDRLPFFAFGFPWREQVVDLSTSSLGAKGVGYGTMECEASAYHRFGFDSSTNLLLMFNRRQALQDGETRAMKKPQGMSGGAVVLAASYLEPAPDAPANRLCAILTECREGKRGALVSVRMHVVGELLDSFGRGASSSAS